VTSKNGRPVEAKGFDLDVEMTPMKPGRFVARGGRSGRAIALGIKVKLDKS